jgi:hypothetical protein
MKKKAQEESASVEAKAIASTQDPRMKLLLLRKEKKNKWTCLLINIASMATLGH